MIEQSDDIDLGSFGTRSMLDKLANRVEVGITGPDGVHAARIIRSFAWMRSRLNVSNNAKLKYLSERTLWRQRAEHAEDQISELLQSYNATDK